MGCIQPSSYVPPKQVRKVHESATPLRPKHGAKAASI